jgi:hypothetical protein
MVPACMITASRVTASREMSMPALQLEQLDLNPECCRKAWGIEVAHSMLAAPIQAAMLTLTLARPRPAGSS